MWKWLLAVAALILVSLALGSRILGGTDHRDLKSLRLQAQLGVLSAAIHQFKRDSGAFPLALDQLLPATADGPGPYAKPTSLIDPWGFPIYYRQMPQPHGFVVFSLGEDGLLGGALNAADRQATGAGGER